MRGMFRPTTKQRKWLYRGSAVYQIMQHPWLIAPIDFHARRAALDAFKSAKEIAA